MSSNRLAHMIAPVILALSPTAALAQEDLIADAPVTETGWTDVRVLSDDSSLDEKLNRLYTNDVYAAAVSNMADKDIDAGIINAKVIRGGDYTGYVTYLDSFTNPEITPEMLVGFGTFAAQNTETTALSENISAITECRENATPAPSQFLKHRQIQGCALTATQNGFETVEWTAEQAATYPHLDPRPYDVKAAELRNSNAYENGVRAQKRYELSAKEWSRDLLVWHSVLSPDASWADIQARTDEFGAVNVNSDKIKYNFDILFECRDQILPSALSQSDVDARQHTFDDIFNCWTEGTQTQYDEQQQHNQNAQIYAGVRIAPTEQKVYDYESGDHQYYAKGVKELADKQHNQNITGGNKYVDYIRLWDAALDTTVDWNSLQTSLNQPENFLRADETNTLVTANMDFVFECRDTMLADAPAPTDLAERTDTLNTIFRCAQEKANVVHTAYNADKKAIEDNPYFDNDTSVSHYRLMQEAYTTPSIDAEALQNAGLVAEDDTTYSLSRNFQAVLDCRATTPANENGLNASAIEVCAGSKARDAFNTHRVELGKSLGMGVLLLGFIVGAGVYGARRYNQYKKRLPAN